VVGMPARPIEMRRRRSSSGPATAGEAEPRAGQAPVPSWTDRNT
jgi:hypothetical protein